MIINCPSCGKRISNKAAQCPHCDATRDPSAPADPAVADRPPPRARSPVRLQSQMYLSLLIAVAGFAWWSWEQTQSTTGEPPLIGTAMMVGGAVWYLVVRAWMVWATGRN